MPITIDLIHDWESIQLEEFQRFITKWGFESQTLEQYLNAPIGTKDKEESRDKAIITWFNFSNRLIPAQPRKLVPNPSLVCPPEVSQGWTMLQQEITKGADLTRRLSRKIENADYNDGILYDWGFHHFHLGTIQDPNHPNLIQGTRIVLLACVDPSEFYPIDFVSHDQWGDITILKKAISAFPDRFERFCIKGISDVANLDMGEDTIKEMRKHGMNLISQIGDKFYSPLGGGMTMAGTSVKSTMELHRYRRQLVQLENQVRTHCASQHQSGEVRLVRSPSANQTVIATLNGNCPLVIVVSNR